MGIQATRRTAWNFWLKGVGVSTSNNMNLKLRDLVLLYLEVVLSLPLESSKVDWREECFEVGPAEQVCRI